MGKAKHTKGPWKIEIDEGYCGVIVSEEGAIVCQFDQDPNKADGILLAAAPELLEALQALHLRIANDADAKKWFLDEQAKAVAAIAKATGGAPCDPEQSSEAI